MSETISKQTFLQMFKSKLIRTQNTDDNNLEKNILIHKRYFFPRQITISMLGAEIIELKFNANIINENTYVRDIAILNIIKKKLVIKQLKVFQKKIYNFF